MQREQIQRLLAIAMVLVGIIQIGLGTMGKNLPFAVFGAIYSLIGVAWLRYL